MTIGDILLWLGLAEQVIAAIGEIIDLQEEVTPETMANIKAKMEAAEQGWADA